MWAFLFWVLPPGVVPLYRLPLSGASLRLVRRVVEGVTAFLVMTFLLCGVLSRATARGVPTLLSKRVSFFLPTTHLAAINTMASHPQRSSRSRSPLGTLPSLAPLPAPSRPSVMSLAAILAADDLFLGSSSHAGFSGPLPPLRLPRGLDALAAAATVVETAPASSPVPAARVDGFTPINHDNSFAASITTVSAVVATPPTAIRHF